MLLDYSCVFHAIIAESFTLLLHWKDRRSACVVGYALSSLHEISIPDERTDLALVHSWTQWSVHFPADTGCAIRVAARLWVRAPPRA
jgi:hypothetical protein